MKKRIAVLLALTLLLASLCGCGGVVSVSASAVPEAQRVKIALWYAPNGSPLWDNFTALLADYNNGSGATAGIRVSAKAFSSESELLTALSEAGAAAPARAGVSSMWLPGRRAYRRRARTGRAAGRRVATATGLSIPVPAPRRYGIPSKEFP